MAIIMERNRISLAVTPSTASQVTHPGPPALNTFIIIAEQHMAATNKTLDTLSTQLHHLTLNASNLPTLPQVLAVPRARLAITTSPHQSKSAIRVPKVMGPCRTLALNDVGHSLLNTIEAPVLCNLPTCHMDPLTQTSCPPSCYTTHRDTQSRHIRV